MLNVFAPNSLLMHSYTISVVVIMPGLVETCKELFDTENLYEVLGIDKSANASQIKKAYHKASKYIGD